jgi:PadR family transcriptional regulator PadR
MNAENAKAQMRKGVLELCILSILSRGDSYTTDLINQLKDEEMLVVEGTLYPLLTRQKNAGLLSYRWEESPQGPPRKYYALTPQGEEYLKQLEEGWDKLVKTVNAIRSNDK